MPRSRWRAPEHDVFRFDASRHFLSRHRDAYCSAAIFYAAARHADEASRHLSECRAVVSPFILLYIERSAIRLTAPRCRRFAIRSTAPRFAKIRLSPPMLCLMHPPLRLIG